PHPGVAAVRGARRSDLSGRQLPAGGVPGHERAAVPRVPRVSEPVRVPADRGRLGRDCRRPPRQRLAGLSVEAADARRVHRWKALRAARLRAERHAAAGAARPPGARRLRGQPDLRDPEPLSAARHRAVFGDPRHARHVHDGGAVVALEEPPLHGAHLHRALLLHERPVSGAPEHHRQPPVGAHVPPRPDRGHRRRRFPHAGAAGVAALGRVAGRHSDGRRVRAGARASHPRRRGGEVIVAADHLSKWYGQVSGLNDVSVSVPPGITGLLGPNGAGKSTFMKLITGQLNPSKGSIKVLGEPIWRNPHLYFQIGFCPEQDAFYERMTGLEWVTALVRLNGLDEKQADEAARRALTAVDLMDAADKKIGAYSKGMRQRVKLAQAIVHDPALLILDEPLAGMDPLARRRTIRLIREWARAGKSVIVSSHILHEIESMTGNILLINNGRIMAEGDVHAIRDLIDEHPHTVYVRAENPRGLAHDFIERVDVRSMKFEENAVTVETGKPDAFYARLTELAASGECGAIEEVTSPDDNLQAVFQYLVK